MAIFGELGKKITQTTQSAVKGTKDFADTARLNSIISDEQKLLNSFYIQIGMKYYELTPNSTDENYADLCASITDCLARIDTLNEEVKQIKGIKRCYSCGAEIPITTTFCGVCGYDTRNAPDYVAPAASIRCSGCNAELPAGAAFCTGCGQKV